MPRLSVFHGTRRTARRFTGPGFVGLVGLVALAASPSARATTVGPLTELATPPAGQRAPAVAWDAQEQVYVIVWEDRRNAGSTGVDLYVARIDPDGTLRDPDGHPLLDAASAADDETQPTIVYNPQTFAHLVGWTEARQGLSDIFVTRVFASRGQAAPTIVPSAGIQVSSGTDSEIEPDVAVAFQTFLVAYQTNVVGGRREIRGRRLYPDGSFLDNASFPLSGNGAASPAALGTGSRFVVAWQNNGDIFARTLPDFGAVATGTAATFVPVVTATLGQSRVDLAQIGPANILATWQDNRAFSTLDADVFGRRFTPTLGAVSMGAPIVTATAAQQFPVSAGNDTGALVAWQDRRFSTTNAIIFAARVDVATGQVLDPEGFPVLALNANAFEPAVAKGPGGDFLVAGVRFDAQTPRIFYRIVRDEVPAGTMSAMGSLMVPADGVTTADVLFGPAVGASGLDVVDGTLYTVMLSDPAVEIVQADADPNLPGHQVRSADGQVFLQLRTIEHIMVDVTVTSVEGSSSGTGQVTFLNVPPTATQVVLAPDPPRSVEPLRLSYLYQDVNLDPESGTRIQWTANAQVIPAYQDQVTVPANATRKGEQWRAEVRPRDGIEFGARAISNTVVIQNTPPAALDARIVPAEDVRTGTPLDARYVFRDPDNDSEAGTQIRWYESGVEQTDLRDALGVPGSYPNGEPRVIKGQRWWFTVRPSDADPVEPFGELVTSSTVTIVNTAPVAIADPNPDDENTVLERREYTLTGTASSDLDPQDVLTYEWTQVKLGTEPDVELEGADTARPSFVAPSVEGTTFFSFRLVVRDDEVRSQRTAQSQVTVEVVPVPDSDMDRLDDEEEADAGTNPAAADTDRDGLRDGEEVKGIRRGGEVILVGTDPLDEDSDDDGIRDGGEGRSARNADDADPTGNPDGDDLINALDPDSDGDGILDGTELGLRDPLGGGERDGFAYAGTDESAGNFVADADPSTQTNPVDADTDDDTFPDGEEDANRNGAVDDGESDPNDPADPGIPCTSGGDECPEGFGCNADGICEEGVTPEPSCTPLPDTLECCMNGCRGGTPVEPVCKMDGARLECPVGADQCIAGACSEPPPPPAEDGGCAATGAPSSAPAWLALAAALLLIRRRRR